MYIFKNPETPGELEDWKKVDHEEFTHAALFHGVPIIMHKSGQLLILARATLNKRKWVLKYLDSLVTRKLVSIKNIKKDTYMIDTEEFIQKVKRLFQEDTING